MEFLNSLLKHDAVNPATSLGAVVYFVLIFVIAWCINQVIRRVIQRSIQTRTIGFFDKTATPFITQLLRIVTYIVALVIYAHLIPSLRNVGTALLAGVSIASVVIGLAAQNTLGNLIAGISILIYRPFDVGDPGQTHEQMPIFQ